MINNSITKNIVIILIFITCCRQVYADTKIISLTPSNTEFLYELGLGKYIVGTSNFSNYPECAKKLPQIGDIELNIEKIVSLTPTILLDTNSLRASYTELFKRLKLNYVNININSLDDIPNAALQIGNLINEKEKAKKFTTDWFNKLNSIKKLEKKFTFYVEIWNKPIQGASSLSFISKIIEASGGENILKDKNIEYPLINNEKILELNPEIIFLCYPVSSDYVEQIKKRPAWNNLLAVKNNKIYGLNQDLFVRPGPRNIEGIQQIIKLLKQ